LYLTPEHEAAVDVDLSTIVGYGSRMDDRRFVMQDMRDVGTGLPLEDEPRSPVPEIDALWPVRRSQEGYMQYPDISDDRFALVGAGAGSIILASYLTLRGADPENITFFDPSKRFGGIWRDKNVRMGGFNNPAPLAFTATHKLSINDRQGNNMRDFLTGIAHDYLRKAKFVGSEVTGLVRDGDGAWLATAGTKQHEADYVVLANGTPIPRKLDGRRIASNLDEHDHGWRPRVERQQRKLTNKELRSKRPSVLVGLGNSTAAMIKQIHRYEDDHGTTVPYFVLTDRSEEEILLPNMDTRYGKPIKPVFRDPSSNYLTGYSGDLLKDRINYMRMIHNDRVITDVKEITYDDSLQIRTQRGRAVINNARIFVLIGNERDPALFDAIQSVNRKGREPKIRACDGAIATKTHGYNSNAFAVGAVAATRRNPNAAVIPGILSQVPGTTLTIALRSFVRHLGSI
jgi:hypothetical protein